MIESEYEVRLMETELEFVRSLVKDVENGSLDGLELWSSFHADPEPSEEVASTDRS